MTAKGHNIIVIGTSAGGLDALETLISQLPNNLPASIFIVQHIAPEGTLKGLQQRLSSLKKFRCEMAVDGEAFEAGTIYIAPPDRHLLLKKDKILVTKGARENRYRPAIDPLFRTAAVEFGPQVIGVILTGLLDDGTAGIVAVKRCGGTTIVQDPDDAAYPDMPQSALNSEHVDFTVPLSKMGSLIERLVYEEPKGEVPIPSNIRTEAEIAERVVSNIETLDEIGNRVPYVCPSCGGALWQMQDSGIQRFRCHTGHAYTANALAAEQAEKIEETLWVSLRQFEEKRNLLQNLQQEQGHTKSPYNERIEEVKIHIKRIRDMLHATDIQDNAEMNPALTSHAMPPPPNAEYHDTK
jgi:two-component system chemotaxis response regulator CheB